MSYIGGGGSGGGSSGLLLETGTTLRVPSSPAIGPIVSTVISDGKFNAFPGLALYGPTSEQLFCNYMKSTTVAATDGIWYYKISLDMGATWGAETSLYNPGGGNTAQDTNSTTLANGNILVSGFRVIGSTTSVIVITGTVDISGNIVFGSPVSVPNTLFSASIQATSGKAIQLANGTLVLPVYGFVVGDGLFGSTGVTFSTDNGATWGNPVLVVRTNGSTDWNEANGFQLENGNIILIIRQDGAGATPGYYRSVSTDNGLTWSAPSEVIDMGGSVSEGRPAVTYLGNNRAFMWIRGPTSGSTLPNSQWTYSADAGVTWPVLHPYKPASPIPFYNYASNVKVSNYLIASVVARGETGNTAPCDITYQSFVE